MDDMHRLDDDYLRFAIKAFKDNIIEIKEEISHLKEEISELKKSDIPTNPFTGEGEDDANNLFSSASVIYRFNIIQVIEFINAHNIDYNNNNNLAFECTKKSLITFMKSINLLQPIKGNRIECVNNHMISYNYDPKLDIYTDIYLTRKGYTHLIETIFVE